MDTILTLLTLLTKRKEKRSKKEKKNYYCYGYIYYESTGILAY